MWIFPVFGLILGIGLGIWLPLEIPIIYSHYFAVVLMVIMDGLLTGVKQGLENNFDSLLFWSGLFVLAFSALLLVYIGEHLGVELYLAVLFALGIRIFNSITSIHSLAIRKFKSGRFEKREK